MHHDAHPIQLPTASGAISGIPQTGYVNVTSIAGRETAGFPVSAIIRELSVTGPIVATLTCAASGVGVSSPIAVPVKGAAPLYCQIVGTGTLDAAIAIL